MDVERIQKINNLALDLMRQGLASDREDAIAQAEKIFRQQDSSDYSSIRNTMNAQSQEETKQADSSQSAPESSLTKDEIKEILGKNTDFLVKTIQEFQRRVESMEKEMSSLKNKVAYNKLPTVREITSAPPVQAPQQTQAAPAAQPQQQQPTQNAQVPKDHPRAGKFNSDDVSIEKFFYMGSR